MFRPFMTLYTAKKKIPNVPPNIAEIRVRKLAVLERYLCATRHLFSFPFSLAGVPRGKKNYFWRVSPME